MADTGSPMGTDLRSAQEQIRAMMAPSPEENASAADASEDQTLNTEAEEAFEAEAAEEPTDGEGYEDEVGDQPEEGRTFTVKVNGQEIEVTEDELLNGYSRQQDYTRKSQELAERRKAFEAHQAEIDAERAQYAQLLPALRQQIEQQLSNEPDWDSLYQQNPTEAMKLERQWKKAAEMRQQQLQAVEAEQQRLAAIQQSRAQEEMARYRAAEEQRLPELIPSWKDTNTMAKEAKEVREFLLGKGFSTQDVDAINSASLVALARNAMLYERGQTNVRKAQAGGNKSGPKVMKAGSRGTQSRPKGAFETAQQRLKQSGRVSDAAAAIKTLL